MDNLIYSQIERIIDKDLPLVSNLSNVSAILNTLDDINWEIINNGKDCEENKEILVNYMRENDIYGVKPFKDLLEIIKEQINETIEKIIGKQYDDYTKYDKNVQRRKESDLDNIYKAYINKKRKISEEDND